MYRKILLASVLLAIGMIPRCWGTSESKGRSQSKGPTPANNIVQRRLFHDCEYAAEQSKKHLDELARGVRQGHSQANEVQPHLAALRSSVTEMLEDHWQLLRHLTEQQWAAGRNPLTKLEMLRATLNSDLEGMDMELRMPIPDPRILTRYVNKTDRALREWKKEHQSMGVAVGMTTH